MARIVEDVEATEPASQHIAGDALAPSRFVMIVGVTAVLFFLGLLPLEAIPEIPVDIDSKPFFIPLVLLALLPAGRPSIAIGLGVALGEFLRDLMEGYELDDPIGFVGYAVAFALTGMLFGKAPPGRTVIIVASVLCAFVQAAIEASSFLLFGEESLGIVIQSTLGNTLMHGIIWGAIPALFVVPMLHGRFEPFLGFAVKGRNSDRRQLTALPPTFVPDPDAVAWMGELQFRYPASAEPVLRGISLDLRPGEVLGIAGRSGSGKSTLCRVLAGVAPVATGGELVGRLNLGASAVNIGYVADSPSAMLTRTRAVNEVEASLDHLALPRKEARERALAALKRVGIAALDAERYIWELPQHRQLLVALAAALVNQPRLLILDEVATEFDKSGLALLQRAITAHCTAGGTAVLVDSDLVRLCDWADRAALIDAGKVAALGPTREVVADHAMLERVGLALTAAPSATTRPTCANAPAVLAMRDVAFSYPEGPCVWEGAGFDLRHGEVLGILGGNGAGKTTLARLLGQLAEPQVGTIELLDIPNEGPADPDRAVRLAVVLHEPGAFFSEACVRDEIALSLRRHGAQRDAIAQRVDALASEFGLGSLLDADPQLLPKGPARLVQIAAMLARGAPVLVLDEPGVRMDPVERFRLTTVIRQFAADGGSVIVLDHDCDLLAALADRIGLIEHRGITMLGTAHQAFAPNMAERLAALDLRVPMLPPDRGQRP